MSSKYDTEYVWDGYDEFKPVKPAPQYKVSKSQKAAWQAIQQTNGLTTVLRLETGELAVVKGRAEIIGVYDPSIPPQQFRSDIL